MKLPVNEIVAYGRMKLTKRTVGDYRFPVWTAVHDCEDTLCVAHETCPEQPEARRDRRCLVITNYLKEAERMAYCALGDNPSEFDLYRVGMQMIPLYKQLARMKILEMSISSRGIAETTKSGTTKIHGVFKALIDVDAAINRSWRDLGIGRAKKPDDPAIPIKPAIGYYEAMEKDAEKEGQTLKLVRRNG